MLRTTFRCSLGVNQPTNQSAMIHSKFVLRLGWGRHPASNQVLIDGGLHGQTIRLEGGIGSHGVRFSDIIVGVIAAEWIGFCIERAFAIACRGIDARRTARGVAADADELAGLPRPAIDLASARLD